MLVKPNRNRGKGDKPKDSKADGASISMHALPGKPGSQAAAAAAAPTRKPDPVAAVLQGNEKLFSGKVGAIPYHPTSCMDVCITTRLGIFGCL